MIEIFSQFLFQVHQGVELDGGFWPRLPFVSLDFLSYHLNSFGGSFDTVDFEFWGFHHEVLYGFYQCWVIEVSTLNDCSFFYVLSNML